MLPILNQIVDKKHQEIIGRNLTKHFPEMSKNIELKHLQKQTFNSRFAHQIASKKITTYTQLYKNFRINALSWKIYTSCAVQKCTCGNSRHCIPYSWNCQFNLSTANKLAQSRSWCRRWESNPHSLARTAL